MTPDKKRLAEAKRKMDLHVLLLQEKFGYTKSQAQVEAYVGGIIALDALMKTSVKADVPLLDAIEKAPK